MKKVFCSEYAVFLTFAGITLPVHCTSSKQAAEVYADDLRLTESGSDGIIAVRLCRHMTVWDDDGFVASDRLRPID